MKSNQIVNILLNVIFVVVQITSSKELPSWINKCRADDENIGKCIQQNVEVVQTRLLNGVPELRLPSFNPLEIQEATIQNPGDFKGRFTDIKIYYADEFLMPFLKVNLPSNHVELKLKFPRMRINSTYHFSGKVLGLNIVGEGPSDGNFTNIEGTFVLNGTRIKKNGQEYIKFNDLDMDLDIGKPKFEFVDLFKNNKELTDRTNEVVNENIESIIEELHPVLNEIIKNIVLSLISGVFDKYSFNELFS